MATLDLIDIRTRLKKATGRYELDDSELNDYINAGQRQLDLRQPTFKSRARYQRDIQIGESDVNFEGCIAIEEVWITNADGDTQLRKLTYEEIKQEYPKVVTSITTGTPHDWAPYPEGLSAQQQSLTSGDFTSTFTFNSEDIEFGILHLFTRSIVFRPPTDKLYTITIIGQFYSKTLLLDGDASYWTQMHPYLLVASAAWEMEAMYRNTAGQQDWENAMAPQLNRIDQMLVREEIAQARQMRG